MYSNGSDQIKQWIIACDRIMKEGLDAQPEEQPQEAEPEKLSPLKALRRIRKLASIEIGPDDDPDDAAKAALAKIAEIMATQEEPEEQQPQAPATPDQAAADANAPAGTELSRGIGLDAAPPSGGQI